MKSVQSRMKLVQVPEESNSAPPLVETLSAELLESHRLQPWLPTLHVKLPSALGLHEMKLNEDQHVRLVRNGLSASPEVSGEFADAPTLSALLHKPSHPVSDKHKREQICNPKKSTCQPDTACTIDATCRLDEHL